MKAYGAIGAAFALAALLAGCNTLGGQPQMRSAIITPAELWPGDTALITVHVADPEGVIHRVEGTVREDDRIRLRLYDDGTSGDEVAGDNIWSLAVDVPYEAAPGRFTLDFTAYRADGQPVPVRDASGEVTILTQTTPMIIRPADTPREGLAPAEAPEAAEVPEGNRGQIMGR